MDYADTVCPFFLIPEILYYWTTSNTDMRTICPITYVVSSPDIVNSGLASGIDLNDAIYKYELDQSKLLVSGTYTLNI
jgi:hypothetical protein